MSPLLLDSIASSLCTARKAKDDARVERITDVIAAVRAGLENPLAAFRSWLEAEQDPGDVTFTGGSGASTEQAVAIDGSAGAFAAQSAWLNEPHPTLQKLAQGLTAREKKYDEIHLEAPDGTGPAARAQFRGVVVGSNRGAGSSTQPAGR